jgi:RNA polymerase-interacting CarD/CdnL/TRCF family regulator
VTPSGFPLRSPAPTGLWAERSIGAQIHRLKQVNEELITEITRSRVRRAGMRKEVDEKRKQVGKRRANLERLQGGGGEHPSSSSPSSYQPRKTVQWDVQEADSTQQLLTKIKEQRDEDLQTKSALRRARKVLVTELVSIYGVRPRRTDRLGHDTGDVILEAGGRRVNGTGNRHGTRSVQDADVEMEIAGLWLPTPKHFTGEYDYLLSHPARSFLKIPAY